MRIKKMILGTGGVAILLVGLGVTPVHGPPPMCQGGICEPDPGSGDYGGIFQARPQLRNARGRSSPIAPATVSSPSGSQTNPGSESYDYAIPVLQIPGRSGLDLSLTLYYNSRVWTVDDANGKVSFNADRDFPGYGFRLGFGYLEYSASPSRYLLTEADGTKRNLRFVSGTTFESSDTSYIDYNSTTRVLRRKDGTQWLYEQVGTTTFYRPIQIQDTNGNYLTITYRTDTDFSSQAIDRITDTRGPGTGNERQVVFNYDTEGRLISITGPAFGGGTKSYLTLAWGTATLTYAFTSLAVVETLASGSSINVITDCTYPNGTGYHFSYGAWGIVNRIERRSALGGVQASVEYNYPGTTPALSDHPTFTQQTVSDGVNTSTWTYAVTKSGGLVSSYSLTDPAGTTTKTNLWTTAWQAGLTSSVEIKAGTTVHRTVATTWLQDAGTSSPPVNPRPSVITTTLNDADPDQLSTVEFTYGAHGNVMELREFDYGLVLARETRTDYLGDPAYEGQHILDRPVQVRVYDAGGALRVRTDLAYDTTPLVLVSGAANHDDAGFGVAFLTRGNLSSATRYADAAGAGGPIVNSYSFDTTGNLRQADVDCCQQQTWNYTAATEFAYPEEIGRGSGATLSVFFAYDLATGLVLTSWDENLQATMYSYDAMNRPLSVTRPDLVSLTASYDDTGFQPKLVRTMPIDAGESRVDVAWADGLGRPVRQQVQTGSGQVDSIVDTVYDGAGRVLRTSNPYRPPAAPVWTDREYDALGRVTKIIPPGGTPASNHLQYEYVGNQVTATDPAGLQRRWFVDALGRTVQVDEPGYEDMASGSGSVGISGSVKKTKVWYGPGPNDWEYVSDSGFISVTVGTFATSVGYGAGSTTPSLASALAAQINAAANAPVTASAAGASLNLVAKEKGEHTNYALSTQVSWNEELFSSPSFAASPSGPALTGGTDGGAGPPSLATPLITYYTFDVLDNLTLVRQGEQLRSFVFDSLGRLTSESTPEAGLVAYTYTPTGQVASLTDARGVVACYSYDGLNRPTQIRYTSVDCAGSDPPPVPTPNVSFTYGDTVEAQYGTGRLHQMTDGTGSETFWYDLLGRVRDTTKVLDGVSYSLHYEYNQASSLTALLYPSGRRVDYVYNGLGQIGQVRSSPTPIAPTDPLVTGVVYNAAGQATQVDYANGVTTTQTYNDRLQLATVEHRNPTQSLLNLAYGYGSTNNGQIRAITDGTDPSRSTTFTYL